MRAQLVSAYTRTSSVLTFQLPNVKSRKNSARRSAFCLAIDKADRLHGAMKTVKLILRSGNKKPVSVSRCAPAIAVYTSRTCVRSRAKVRFYNEQSSLPLGEGANARSLRVLRFRVPVHAHVISLAHQSERGRLCSRRYQS